MPWVVSSAAPHPLTMPHRHWPQLEEVFEPYVRWDPSVLGEETGLKGSCILTPEKLLGSKKGVLDLPHLPSLLSSLLALCQHRPAPVC